MNAVPGPVLPPVPSPPVPPPVMPPGADRVRLAVPWRRVGSFVVAAALIGASLVLDLEPLSIVGFVFVLVVPFEKLVPRHRGQRLRRDGVGTDLAFALSQPLLGVVTVAVAFPIGVVSLAWLPGLALSPLVAAIPEPLLPFVGVALFDLAIYWVHRWSHEVPFLWRFHSIHHSSETMDWISGFRNHPLDGAIVAPPFVFLVAAGFTTEFTGIVAIVQILTGLFLHANVRWRWRPLHKVLITPEFHHWHHADEPDAHFSNYATFLPLWDLLFGTYFMSRERRPAVYGVSQPIPRGITAQLRHPLRGMGNPLRVLRHPIRSSRAGVRFVRALCADIWRSTRRSTRGAPAVAVDPGSSGFRTGRPATPGPAGVAGPRSKG